MLIGLLTAKAAIAGAWFVLLFAAERLARADAPPSSMTRVFRNVGLWLLASLFSAGIVAPLTAWGADEIVWTRPKWMADSLTILALDLVILDCWTYWLHRAYHRAPLMWRLHQVHHRDEFLDTTSAVRFHFFEVGLSAGLRLGLIALLAIPLRTVVIYEIALLCASFFHHSNLRLPPRLEAALSRIIVTPSIHWVHHHAVWADTNSNYAACLSVWDRLFGTRSPSKRAPGMKIGVEGVEDEGLVTLLLSPFKGVRS